MPEASAAMAQCRAYDCGYSYVGAVYSKFRAIAGRMYAVRPIGALGTCGWIGGRPWQVIYIAAANASRAVTLAMKGKQ